MYDAFLLAHGDKPTIACLRALVNNSRHVIALNGASEQLIALKLWPDFILGDLDSVSAAMLKSAARHRARVVHIKEQETPDLEKGLHFCKSKRWERIVLAGFLGPRLDHSLNALSAVMAYPEMEITLVTSESIGRVIHGRKTLKCSVKSGLKVSVMPMPVARGVTLSGVKWPLRNKTLKQSGTVSLSNEATESVATMRQNSGCSIFILQRRRGQITLDICLDT